MNAFLIVYVAGFIGTAAFFGWNNEPCGERLWNGLAVSILWPLIWLFAVPAGIAAAIKDFRA